MTALAYVLSFAALLWIAGQGAVHDAPLATLLILGLFGWLALVAWRGRAR